MRLRIIPLFFAVLFLVFTSSCSLPSKTTATTTKCLEINPHIEQIPTLVELSVDSTLVKIDSCWTDSLFHQTFSVNKEIDNLIGRALEQHNGDVFVLPNSVWEKQGIGFLKTEHYLSVTGYIGRYKRFRTATLEDIKTINEYKYGPENQQPDAPLTAIYLGRNDLYGGRWDDGVASEPAQTPIKKIIKNGEKKPFQRKKGFSWGFEYSMGFLNAKGGTHQDFSLKEVGDMYWVGDYSFVNLNLSFGAMLNEYLYLGGGAGFKWMTSSGKRLTGNWVPSKNIGTARNPIWTQAHYENIREFDFVDENFGAPVFVHTKVFFSNSFFSPVWDLKLGFHFANSTGFYLQTNLGVSIGVFYLGANFDLVATFEKNDISQVQVGPIIAFHF